MHRPCLLARALLGAAVLWAVTPDPTVWCQETTVPSVRQVFSGTAQTVFRPDLTDDQVLGLKLDHPLAPALELALDSYRLVRADIRDYTCQIVRRERVEGRLQGYEYMDAKIRHERTEGVGAAVPFSVYLKFAAPDDLVGREVLYVQGRNNDQLRARRGGRRFAYVTGWLPPDSPAAMQGNRYPVTEIGIENLLRRLIQLAREELGHNRCQVRFSDDARLDERPCRCLEVIRPKPDQEGVLQRARIFMDQELRLPVHFESYEAPADRPEALQLVEQYSYRRIRLNVGLSEADFDIHNPAYQLK